MNEMQQMAVKVDSLFYEEAVDTLVEHINARADIPRELHLLDGSIMITENLSTEGRIASLAIMAIVMLAEERKRNSDE